MDTRNFKPEALWIARKRQGLSQQECAKSLGKHRYTVIRIEQGNVSDISEETVLAYADLLHVPHTEIFASNETSESFFASTST